MNAARRARQKAHRENAHDHQNRAARTDPDTGEVARCLFCRPTHHANEKTQQHGGMIFRPVQGKLTWAQRAVRSVVPKTPGSQTQMEETAERLGS